MKIERPKSKQQMPEDAELVFKGVVFDVYQWQVQGYDGTTKTFEKLKRPDTVIILPVTENGQIIMTKQEQPGKYEFTGLAGGRVDEDEDILEAAKRELLEETGFKAAEWELFDAVQPTSKIEWAVFTFIARGCEKVAEQELDGAEKIELISVDFDEFIEIATQKDFEEQELKMRILQAKTDVNKMDQLKKMILG